MRRAGHVLEYNVTVFRATWRSSAVVAFLGPVLFLGAMGVGLGSLVRSSTGLGGVSYVRFIGPGLLATSAMQAAAQENTYPIMMRTIWNRVYEAMLATPLRVADIVVGEIGWIAVRMLMTATLFFAAMSLFGVVRSPQALLAIPVAALTGTAFGVPVLAFTASQRTPNGFSILERFVVLPLFILGGAFFPLSQLPAALQAVAWATPLSHGVTLCRELVLGTPSAADAAVHIAVCVGYVIVGTIAATRIFARRLRV